MANANFHDRVQRIQANAEVQASMRPKASRKAGGGGRIISLATSAVLTVTGGQAIKYANDNYETLRDSGEMGMVLGFAVGGLILTVIGISMFFRSISSPTGRRAAKVAEKRKPADAARLLFSLIGLVTGGVSCLCMLMADAAVEYGTETASQFADDSVLIATSLLIVALLFGLVSLLRRGRGLGYVPVYFILGAALAYGAVVGFGVNFQDWNAFVTRVQ